MRLNLLALSVVAMASSFSYANDAVTVYSQGNKTALVSEGSNLPFILGDDISVPTGLKAHVFSGENGTGEKQIILPGESPSISFKSLTVLNDNGPGGLFVNLKDGRCIDLAIEAVDGFNYVNLYSENEGHRGKMMGMDSPFRKFKQVCSTDEVINIYELAKNKLSNSAFGKEILLSAYGVTKEGYPYGYNFYLKAFLPKTEGDFGKFSPDNFGYMGNYSNYQSVMTIDNENGKVIIGL